MNIWHTAWRNLMRRKLRTLLTFLSIVIGVASTFAVVASVDTAKKTFPLYLKAAFGKADYLISGTETYMPEKVYKDVEQLNYMASIAVLKQSTKLHLEQEGISALQKRVELGGYTRLDTPLTNFSVIQGSLTSGGAVITDRTAKAWKVGVGDTISFDTAQGTKQIQVSAIVKYTVELMGPSSWSMAKYHHWAVAVPLNVLQDWFGLDGKIQNVQIKAASESDRLAVERQIDELVKRYGNMYMQPVLIDSDSVKEADTFFMALYIAGFLGIALSGFIIFNTLYVSIKERKQEFAVLKTIGYLPKQLQAFVLFEVFLLAIAGTAVGLLFGYGFAQLLSKLIFMLFSIHDEGSMLIFKGFAVSVLAGLLIPFAAALIPIRQVGKISVVEVLKPGRTETFSRKWQVVAGLLLIVSGFFIKHLLLVVPLMLGVALVYPHLFKLFHFVLRPVYRRLFGFSGQMAASNLRRNLGRTSMTSVILCLGIAMVVLMSSINSAFIQSFEKVIYSSYGGNLDIHFHHTEKTDVERLKSIQGVADARAYGLYSAIWTLNGQQRKLPVYGVGEWIDRFPLFTVSGKSRSELVSGLKQDEVILDKIAYGVWGGKIGESIELATLQGKRTFKVAAVVSTMKNNGYGAFMKEESFKENFGLKFEHNVLVIKDENATPLQLREHIFNQFGERIEDMFGPEDWASMVGSVYTGSFSVINALIVLSIVISGMGITNTLLINIMERIRELGMMRAVGVTRRQVVGMIMLEGLGIGIAATVIGCIFGIVLIFITSTFFEIHSLTYQFGVSWTIILYIGLFGIAVSLVSSFTPASRAAQTRLSEALRYE
ncbi:peptide ABC transporter permease [Gordoniibacillus kamchatkensis]|uniref:Peptide ABC transporter permease n=1 Tax=Gordoniibacillus kamchatkensis TaxID=1590651 RepID=A0ABR5AC37_9BACL|nr:ABC transporter permease [Paenibacillus sp. VKM B-2647]KIL38408.1 peptide ABC transporter permease [Paenibacillus sp. VKM B-2647]